MRNIFSSFLGSKRSRANSLGNTRSRGHSVREDYTNGAFYWQWWNEDETEHGFRPYDPETCKQIGRGIASKQKQILLDQGYFSRFPRQYLIQVVKQNKLLYFYQLNTTTNQWRCVIHESHDFARDPDSQKMIKDEHEEEKQEDLLDFDGFTAGSAKTIADLVRNGEIEELGERLNSHDDIYQQLSTGQNCIEVAVEYNQLEVLKLFRQHFSFVDWNRTGMKGLTPFTIAVEQKREDIVRWMILMHPYELNVNAPNDDGTTARDRAPRGSSLLEAETQGIFDKGIDFRNQTRRRSTVVLGMPRQTRPSIDQGSESEEEDPQEKSERLSQKMNIAKSQENIEDMVRGFLSIYEAKIDDREEFEGVDRSLMDLAIMNKNTKLVKILHEKFNARLDVPNSKDGNTPLILSVVHSAFSLVQYICSTGQANKSHRNKDNKTALDIAVESLLDSIVQELRREDLSDLFRLVREKRIRELKNEIHRKIRDEGFHIDSRDIESKQNLIECATQNEDPMIMQMLFEAFGADITRSDASSIARKTKCKETMECCRRLQMTGRIFQDVENRDIDDVMNVLEEEDWMIDQRWNNRTLLSCAQEQRFEHLVQFLKDKGATR